MNLAAFERAFGRRPERSQPFGVPLRPKLALSQAALDHYWHPDRDGVEQAPKAFTEQLLRVHADLACVRPPGNAPLPHPRAWILWYRKPTVTYPLCPGWSLLFIWRHEGEPLPLDERVFANLYMISSMHFGGASGYFESIVTKMQDEKAGRDKADQQYRDDRTKDYFQSTKIKNIGKGNKFALHHDGTILPGRGERNWLKEREAHMLPASVAAEKRRARERSRG